MRKALDEGKIVIVAGFQGIDENYNITTSAAAASDTTAVALAAVMQVDVARPASTVDCEIYTDVDGIYTTDPRLVPEARKIDAISYDEMLELASLGAGVMHSRSHRVRQEIRRADAGPQFVQRRRGHLDRSRSGLDARRRRLRRGASSRTRPASHSRRARPAGRQPRDLRGHRRPEHRRRHDRPERRLTAASEIGFTVLRSELPRRWPSRSRSPPKSARPSSHDEDVSKVSIVGTGMRTHTGVAEKMFAALAAGTST